jgi:uncharacterized membrane protein YfcA
VPDLSALDWTLLALGVVAIGFAKTAISGTGSIAVAAFALVLPARESTGTILPLLILGDLFAIAYYRQHTDWGLIRRLVPWVGVGIVAGAGFVAVSDDTVMRRTIGALLLVLAVVQLVTGGGRLARLVEGSAADDGGARAASGHRVLAAGAGIAAGFVTMVANAAGAVMTIYLLLSGLAMLEFLGTAAWFFFLVNLAKLPFSIGLGLVAPGSLLLDLALAPLVAVGAVGGVVLVRRLDEAQFEKAVLALAALSAVPLLL